MIACSLPGDLAPGATPTPYHAPRTRRGTPGVTPEMFYQRMRDLRELATMPGVCVLCGRRKGKSFAVRLPPESSRLASILPMSAGPIVIPVCGRCSRSSAIRALIDELPENPAREGDPSMITSAALADPNDVLLVGDLMVHRKGAEPRRPYLQVAAWCPFCRHEHFLPWPDVFRLDSVEPVELPCRGGPQFGGRRVFVGLDPGRRAEQKRISDDFAASLRRFLVQRRLERQLVESRLGDRSYLRDFPEAAFSTPPVDRLGSGWPPPIQNTSNHAPFQPLQQM
jgi:hypothetical protein